MLNCDPVPFPLWQCDTLLLAIVKAKKQWLWAKETHLLLGRLIAHPLYGLEMCKQWWTLWENMHWVGCENSDRLSWRRLTMLLYFIQNSKVEISECAQNRYASIPYLYVNLDNSKDIWHTICTHTIYWDNIKDMLRDTGSYCETRHWLWFLWIYCLIRYLYFDHWSLFGSRAISGASCASQVFDIFATKFLVEDASKSFFCDSPLCKFLISTIPSHLSSVLCAGWFELWWLMRNASVWQLIQIQIQIQIQI